MSPEQLVQWRESKGLTRPEMAAFVGVPFTTYKNWERGDKGLNSVSTRLLELVQKADVFYPDLLK